MRVMLIQSDEHGGEFARRVWLEDLFPDAGDDDEGDLVDRAVLMEFVA